MGTAFSGKCMQNRVLITNHLICMLRIAYCCISQTHPSLSFPTPVYPIQILRKDKKIHSIQTMTPDVSVLFATHSGFSPVSCWTVSQGRHPGGDQLQGEHPGPSTPPSLSPADTSMSWILTSPSQLTHSDFSGSDLNPFPMHLHKQLGLKCS